MFSERLHVIEAGGRRARGLLLTHRDGPSPDWIGLAAGLSVPKGDFGKVTDAVLTSSGTVAPYLIGGYGVYHASAVCSSCTTTSTKGGFNGGAGFRFGLTGFSAFVEGRFHHIAGASDPTNGGDKSSSAQFIPVSFGVRF